MFYSHDTYGLGHLRRTLALASFFRSRRPLSQLIVTGSPLAHRFRLPRDADYIKLPSVVKVAAGTYESRSLDLPFRAVRNLRRDVLLGAAHHFRPSLLVVDNVPGGLKGELAPTLRFLKSIACRLVLGLRDVVDEADRVRSTWDDDGSYDLLDDVYDRIVVYGAPEIYDPVEEYAFPQRAAEKTRFVGYLGRPPGLLGRERVRSDLAVGDAALVLVMAGGGEDGYRLLRTFLEAMRLRGGASSFDCLLVGGPLMPPAGRRHVEALARERSVRFVDFLQDVTSYVEAADVVVSMGGYNSVCELLSFEKPALVVPRVSPRKEQLIRAEELSARGCLRMLHPAQVDPRRLLAEVTRLVDERPQPAKLPLDGLAGTADALDELLADAPEARRLAGACVG
jgi:predicted glycosyltransferase